MNGLITYMNVERELDASLEQYFENDDGEEHCLTATLHNKFNDVRMLEDYKTEKRSTIEGRLLRTYSM